MISSIKTLFNFFRHKPFIFLCDLSKAYRSIDTSHINNIMRLHAYPVNIEDPYSHFTILMLLRLTYGDVMASCILELVMKEVLAPLCSTDLARTILMYCRYIDDMVGGDHNEQHLLAAFRDLKTVLAFHGFGLKIVLPTLK